MLFERGSKGGGADDLINGVFGTEHADRGDLAEGGGGADSDFAEGVADVCCVVSKGAGVGFGFTGGTVTTDWDFGEGNDEKFTFVVPFLSRGDRGGGGAFLLVSFTVTDVLWVLLSVRTSTLSSSI